jgi:general secretion pathway protein D
MRLLNTKTLLCVTLALSVALPTEAQRSPEEAKAREERAAKARERAARSRAARARAKARAKAEGERRERRTRRPRRAGGPAAEQPPAPTPTAAAPRVGTEPAVPGEAEFNSCRRYPAHRRVKFTLKPGSDLKDLVAWISQMTCKKFIVAETLRAQKVTVISPTAVTAGEAYRAFLSALEVMGLTVVPAGRYLKVVQGNWAIQSPIKTYGDKKRVPADDAVVTRLVQVGNVDVNELLLVLNKMKSRSGDVTAYKPTNMLIITDSGLNVRRMVRIIKELDIEIQGEKIWVVRLKNADAQEVHKILSQIFGQQRPNIPVVKGKGGGGLSASKIVADPESNSLIIVASPGAFAKIASLIKKLDVESEGANQRIHVYYLENADSEDLSNTLSGLTGAGGGVRRPGRRGGRQPRRTGPAPTTSLFEGEVKISPDKATNSLVIIASTKDYLSLRRVIKKLDIPRRQVFVEASILEISLDKSRKLGFAYHGGGIAGEGDSQSIIFGGVQHSEWGSLVFNPLALMGLAVGARGAPVEGSAQLLNLPTDIPGFGVMFQALQNNNNVNVLSSPHLLTTDNEEAEITVGQNIPFQGAFVGGSLGSLAGQTGSQSSALTSFLPTVSVQRQDVALKLKLTPHVNDSDMVRLELEQEVSDIASQNFNGLGPSTSKRTAKTVVVVRDQQTVVIGGLMGNRVQDSVSKVPLLGDIPILGYFFKYSTKTVQKTNLLIVLTPYVIRDQSDLRRIFKKKLEERREFIERYTTFKHRELGGDVDYRHKRGLLSEINKVGAQAEVESKLLQEAQQQTEEPPEGVDMPKGMSPSPGASPSPVSPVSPVRPPPTDAPQNQPPSIRRPPVNPDRSIRLDRQPRY